MQAKTSMVAITPLSPLCPVHILGVRETIWTSHLWLLTPVVVGGLTDDTMKEEEKTTFGNSPPPMGTSSPMGTNSANKQRMLALC